MRKILLLLFVLFMTFNAGDAQQLTNYEYWFDTAYSNVVIAPIIGTPQELFLNEQINTTGLSTGFHFFHIRFMDANGKYSSVSTQIFQKTTQNNGLTALINYEYWFDGDYANKVSTSIANLTEFDLNSVLTTNLISTGLHVFHIRFQDNGGNWSTVISQSFIKVGGLNTTIVNAEYWFDNDYLNHVDQAVNNQTEYALNTDIAASSLINGVHVIKIRFLDGNGAWSSVISQPFLKAGGNIVSNTIIAYRYWFNTSSNNIFVTLPSPQNPYDLLSQIDTRDYTSPGSNTLNIQFEDTIGLWSSVLTDTFTRAAIPVAYFTSNSPVCFNNPINFNDSSTEANSYYWDFGDGNHDTVYSPSHIYSSPGNYTVS